MTSIINIYSAALNHIKLLYHITKYIVQNNNSYTNGIIWDNCFHSVTVDSIIAKFIILICIVFDITHRSYLYHE